MQARLSYDAGNIQASTRPPDKIGQAACDLAILQLWRLPTLTLLNTVSAS